MDILEKPPVRKGLQIVKWILILSLCCGGILLLAISYKESLRYFSVRNKAVSVQAVVIEVVEVWDSETGIDYDIYVSYTYRGTRYTDHYDTLSSKKKAEAMLGKEVTVTINPEDPTEQLKDIRSNCDMFLLFGGILLMCGIFCAGLHCHKWGAEVSGWYQEVIYQDIRSKVLRGSAFWIGLFCIAAIWLAMYLLWPEVYHFLFAALGGIALVTGTVLLALWIGRLRLIDNRQYIVGRDELVNKTVHKDSDGTTYYLHYTNGQKEWKRSVTPKKYAASQVGTVIETVRLKEKGRPYLCFSRSDNEGF